MKSTWFRLAGEIITQASRDRPADLLLRQTLKSQSDLTPEARRWISESVFIHFRWLGWLKDEPVVSRIHHARELDSQFQSRPDSFSDHELLKKAVPSWCSEVMLVTAEWARHLQSSPPLWLRAKKGRAGELTRILGDAHAPYERIPEALLYEGQEDLFHTQAFRSGLFEIQDVASQAAALMCGASARQTWWDACAGEGGKTLSLSESMENKGLIWASDRAEWRLRMLSKRAARAQAFNIRTVLWNNPEKPPTKTRFDGVLVDAPCTGMGTWQRNPHARWTTTMNDVNELAGLQKRILKTAAGTLKPGGRLVYAVCTLSHPETVEVCRQLEAEISGIVPKPSEDLFPPHTHQEKFLWYPEKTGGNGMFVALWTRDSEK